MFGKKATQYIKLILVLLATTLMYGCSSEQEQIMGTYQAVDSGSTESIPATLEFQTGGKGFWYIETDNAPFRWDLYQNRIRLHTESGGVIQGTMDKDKGSIQLRLPGMEILHFKRVR